MGLPSSFLRNAAVVSILSLAACATSSELDLMLQESDRGTVVLERITDRSFQAAHPIKLPAGTVARVLRGVLVRDDQGFLQDIGVRKADALQAFSEEDVAYLAPLITDGLSRAASDQQVGFTVNQQGPPVYSQRVGAAVGSSEPPLRLAPPETTAGSIYAYGRSLYVTLTQYRYRVERPDTINMPNRRVPDRTGLLNHTVMFIPESAKRDDKYRTALSTDTTLVIDYELLAGLPLDAGREIVRQPPPAAPAPASAQGAPAKVGDTNKKDPELEALRKELEDIKRQLADQDTRRQPAPPKPSGTPKSP
ncbi:exported protein of unknown function [Nitrospira japonica]|uniref:Lipoprotein n=1 Tax=Nitrospira japonica TaxID=1325564 RepID=A0A1W1I6B7_9BACT|nr:hypothetical protein [Nitrospira japonica]SLM48552.1 exported protein of unknown function [Nitrospira japonica]